MRILENDREPEFTTIHVDSDDDLWYLRNIISMGDRVKMSVMRRLEKQQDIARSKESQRKPVTLTISVENLEFQEFSGTLRVLGTVIAGAEDALNQHQAFAISPGETFMILKDEWTPHQKELLDEALENKFSDRFFFVVLDDEEAYLIGLKSYGLQQLGKVLSHKTGKDYASDYSEEKYLREVFDSLRKMLPDGSNVIVLGSGFTREKFVKTARNSQTKLNIVTFPTSRSDEGAVWEFLNSPESDSVLENFRLSGDARLVDDFLGRLKTTEEATYGLQSVRSAIEAGAVDVLMMSEEKFRTDEGRELLKLADNFATKVHILSLSGEKGNIIKNFGGYCALLRYKL